MCLVINSSWIWFLWEETIQINWLYSSLFYRLWHAKVWRCVTLFGCGKCRTFGCERSFRIKFKSTKFFEVCTEFRPNLIFRTWVYWKSRCGWVCEVRPTKTHMCLWYTGSSRLMWISLLQFFKTITEIWLMRFYGLFILLLRI